MNKQITCVVYFLLISLTAFSQRENSTTEVFLDNIKRENDSIDIVRKKEISGLKDKILEIDEALQKKLNSTQEVEKLRRRILTLEEIREKEQELKQRILIENYNSAALNLFSMEKDIKPLKLYNASKNFYSSINDISNPINYPDYKEWFEEYKRFLKLRKSKDILLEMASDAINTSETLSNNNISLGGFGSLIISSIEKFISSLGKGKKELRRKSVKMLKLIVLLDNFENERDFLIKQSKELNKELEIIENTQSDLKERIIKSLILNRVLLKKNYFEQTDFNKTIQYLQRVKKVIESRFKSSLYNKNEVIHQMNSVQTLKMRFGNLSLKLDENLRQYKSIINKYKKLDVIEFKQLENYYNNLVLVFGDNIDSKKYIEDAVKMYRTE